MAKKIQVELEAKTDKAIKEIQDVKDLTILRAEDIEQQHDWLKNIYRKPEKI